MFPKKDFLLVDFYADWCEPCKWAEPILEEVIKNFNGRLFLHKINIDEHPDVARQFHIMSVPTLMLLKRDEEVWRMKGFDIAPKLYSILKTHID